MFEILLTWIILIPIFVGLGLLSIHFIGRHSNDFEIIFLSFWIGWAISLAFLQIWHFFLPVNGITLIVFMVISICGWILYSRSILQTLQKIPVSKIFVLGLCLIIVGLWLANRSALVLSIGDTALYHQQVVQWYSKYPIVPGLGLLHDRFSYNSASLLYSALLDVSIWNQKSFHLANGLLVWALISHSFSGLIFALSKKEGIGYYVYVATILIPALILGSSNYVISNSPDLPFYALELIFIGSLYRFLTIPKDDDAKFWIFVISIFAAALFIIRVNSLILVTLGLVTTWIFWIWKNDSIKIRISISQILFLSWIPLFIFTAPWFIRNIILSGYLVFPISFISFPVEWRIPDYILLENYTWIKSWARKPNMFWDEVLYSSTPWFPEWIIRVSGEISKPFFITLLISLLHGMWGIPRKIRSFLNGWIVFFILIVSVIVWYLTIPDTRFAGSIFWSLALLSIALFGDRILPTVNKRTDHQLVILFMFLILFTYTDPINLVNIQPNLEISETAPYLVEIKENFQQYETKSGLIVNYPPTTDQCWTIPIPCTPSLNPYLELRIPGELRHGFKLSEETEIQQAQGFHVSANLVVKDFRPSENPVNRETQIREIRSQVKFAIIALENQESIIKLTPYNIQNDFGNLKTINISIVVDSEEINNFNLYSGSPIETNIYFSRGGHSLDIIINKPGDQPQITLYLNPIEILPAQ